MTAEERAVWLEERRKGLGGSDTPVILLGENHPFTSLMDLWNDKVYGGNDVEQTPAMKRGSALEDVVARLYADETGRKLRRVNKILSHKEHPWMLANIDREIVGDERGPGILEIKCPGIKVFSRIKREGIPDYYQIQLQHYLAVTGRAWGAFAVFSAEIWDMVYFDMDRDDELITMIISQGEAFWETVQSLTPPEAEEAPPIKLPAVGQDESFVMLDDDDVWLRAVADYKEAKALLDEAKEMERACRERVSNLMTLYNASIAEGGGMRWHKIQSRGRETFDAKGFFKAHPELVPMRTDFVRVGEPYETLRSYSLRKEKENE